MRRWHPGLFDELTAEVRRQLDLGTALARRLEIDLYLVGGAVRDLLLGEPLRDLDLVWQGAREPETVARAFGRELGARASYHPEFLTASLGLPGGARIDLGRARSETYPAAAALPEVRPASLHEDLRRRDFSVNALAVDTATRELVDPCGGWSDLASRQLRILHADSLRDDPTRILRGCELAVRRGFEFEAVTSAKIAEAIAAGYPSLLSGSRVRHELERLLAAPRRAAAAARLVRRLGVDAALRAELAFDPAGPARLDRLRAWDDSGAETARHAASRPIPFWLMALGLLLWHKSREERRRLASWLHCGRGERDWLEAVPERLAPLIESEPAVQSAIEDMAALYAGLSAAETRLVDLLAEGRSRDRLDSVRRLARLELGISARDLLGAGVAPGPGVGEALAATLAALRRREISTEDELRYATAWLARKAERDAR